MSRVLLDTPVLLWLLGDEPRLGPLARDRIQSAHAVFASTASLWELAIKHSLGKFPDPEPLLDAIERAGVRLLPILPAHALAVRSSPLPHRDPFDRMLLAQAGAESCTLLTADERILSPGLPDVVPAQL